MSAAHTSDEAKQAIEILLKLAHLVDMSDRVKGRIEAKVSFSALGKVMSILQGKDVDKGLKLIPGLKGYELSAWSRSATIQYDPNVIPEDLWDQFCAIRKDPSVEGAVRERLYALIAHGADGRAGQGDRPTAEA
jgi:hypothetical protein